MTTKKDYSKDISEIRQMMERSTKFLSLSGWSGIMAGIYALIGAYVAYQFFDFKKIASNHIHQISGNFLELILLALGILVLAVGTAVFLSFKKAKENNEILWNSTARRLVENMAIPLLTGGIFILILIEKGNLNLIVPAMLIFYGLTLVNASKFTYAELKYFGIFEILLGLLCAYFTDFGLLCWAIGFGSLHIVYGIYVHWKYEK